MTELDWPDDSDQAAWDQLANLAMQFDTLRADLDENARWERAIRSLVRRQLPREQFVAEHLAALKQRVRRRKLDQANIRYRYGFRDGATARARYLVHRDTRACLANLHPSAHT